MRNRMCSTAVAAGFGVMMMSLPPLASATAFDGTKNLVCATTDIVACVDGFVCTQGTAKTFDYPEFVVVDMEAKVLRATEHSGITETSPVRNLEQSGNHMILQGVENGRGWSISIDGVTGRMSGAVSGDGLNYMVFGPCTAI